MKSATSKSVYSRTPGGRGLRGGFFSLAEMITALTIGAMVMVAVLMVYNRAERAASALTAKLDSYQLPGEVMQRISEDLDKAISGGSGTKITVENKFEDGFATSKLSIVKTIADARGQDQTLEEITWQAASNFESDANGLTLYRGYDGINLEDRLLDEQREAWEKGDFVPICEGVTYFKVQVPQGENLLERWTSDSAPPGIVVTISFAAPFKTVAGTLDVYDDEKIVRTIAIDRTRKIRFEIEPMADEEAPEGEPTGSEGQADSGEAGGAPSASEPGGARSGGEPGGPTTSGRQSSPKSQAKPNVQTKLQRP
jgi:hypothetical protein